MAGTGSPVLGMLMICTPSPKSPPAQSYSFAPCGISSPATMNSAGCIPATTAMGQRSPRSKYLFMIMLPCLPFDTMTEAVLASWAWIR